MTDYDIEGEFDSDGTFHGTLTEKGGGDVGGIGGPLTIIIVYARCLIGGIIMLTNVAQEAPTCIIPAVLAFIVMLIPIVLATGSGDFFLTVLINLYKWSDVLIGLAIAMFWIFYILESVSVIVLSVMAMGLMYLTGVIGIRSLQKTGGIGLGVSIAVGVIVYLVVLALSEDFEIGYLAIIPTIMISLSLVFEVIGSLFLSERFGEKIAAVIKVVVYVVVVVCVFSLSGYTTTKKENAIQSSKTYISEGRYTEARQLLQDIKSEEATELYASIRYQGIEVGEIIYNGHYDSDARSASEDGIAFICLDIVDDKALLVCLDIIGLKEQYNGIVSEEYINYYSYGMDMENISTSVIDGKKGKFFLLSKEQYENYVKNDKLSEYLKNPTVSKAAKEDKKDVDEDKYKWTVAHIDYWLLNDFNSDNVGTINVETGEFEYKSNYKNYAGIRPCYYAVI